MSKVIEAAIRGQSRGWLTRLAVALGLTIIGVPASQAQKGTLVEISTELGAMVVLLYDETPAHRDNFKKLVKEGFYDSLLFHRVVPEFMIQGGDPDSRAARSGQLLGEGGAGYTLAAEIVPGLIHRKGALAAARQGEDVNPERHSSGSQFYIVLGRPYVGTELDRIAQRQAGYGVNVQYSTDDRMDYERQGGAPHLDGAYTVFGQVMTGMEVLDKIATVECDQADRPLKDVRMFMRILE